MTPPDKAEYDNQEFIADMDLIGMMSKEQTCSNCKHFVRFNNACMEYGYHMSLCDRSKWEELNDS